MTKNVQDYLNKKKKGKRCEQSSLSDLGNKGGGGGTYVFLLAKNQKKEEVALGVRGTKGNEGGQCPPSGRKGREGVTRGGEGDDFSVTIRLRTNWGRVVVCVAAAKRES